MTYLTWSQVRAWRLERQFLARRAPRTALLEVVSQLFGVQAQVMSAAELAIWARVEGATRSEIQDQLWQKRTLVKTWAMRGTLHVLTAGDFWLQSAAARSRQHLRSAWLNHLNLTAEQEEALTQAVGTALGGRCLTRQELAAEVQRISGFSHVGEALLTGWGGVLKPAAHRGELCFGPNQGRNVTFVRPEPWLGSRDEFEYPAALKEVVRRYLSVYGPTRLPDLAVWWGTSTRELKSALATLGDSLVEVEIEGERAFALADTVGDMARAGEPHGVRLLPNFDNYVFTTRSFMPRFLPGPFGSRVSRSAGWISAVVLVAGRIDGVWDYARRGRVIDVRVSTFVRLGRDVKRGIAEEAEKLGEFLGGHASVTYQ